MNKSKMIILGAAVCVTILAGGVSKTFADDTTPADQKNSTGNVSFTSPSDNALILTKVADFDFGSHAISANDETYQNVSDTETDVQDIRGTGAGWVLQVAEASQFKAGTNELTGAQIKLDTPVLDATSTAKANPKAGVTLSADGTSSVIMDANKGEGNGLAKEDFAVNSASLSVPGATVKDAAQYKTTLNWTLMDQPANK